MGKLAEKLKNIFGKFKSLSLGKKIAYILLISVVVVAIVGLTLYSTSTKYGVLFSNMDENDSKTVIEELTAEKVAYKVQGSSILVPEDQVDDLRLKLASSVNEGSKGFELFDNTGQFGMTDQEMTITYQRALEGELERTLKAFPQVEGARVHLVMEEETAFVKDTKPSKASVTLQLKTGNDLNSDQVNAIVALICGSVKDLDKENVEIVDNKMRLLTTNIIDGETSAVNVSQATESQQKLEENYERKLEDKIMDIVKPVSANGSVKVKVNADLDFDAKIIDSVTKEKGPIVSEKNIESSSTNGGTTDTGLSAVDNNEGTTTYPYNTGDGSSNAKYKENTTNYENGQTETKTNVAPGKIVRLTATVMFDGAISDADKATLEDSIGTAIGFDESRDDKITVAGMKFNSQASDSVKEDLAELEAANQKELQQKLFKQIGIALGAITVLVVIALSLKKRKSKKKDGVNGLEEGGLNVLIGEEIKPKEVKPEQVFEPIDFEVNTEKSHMEKEIRNYAKNKPEQVSDIVKAWLADEER